MGDEVINEEIQPVEVHRRRDVMRSIVTLLCIVGFLGCMAALLFLKVPEENVQLFTQALGSLTTAFGIAVMWHLGSSKGSSDKTELLNK